MTLATIVLAQFVGELNFHEQLDNDILAPVILAQVVREWFFIG